MPWQKGNDAGHKIQKGEAKNPGGAIRRPYLRGSKKAIKQILDCVVEELDTEEAVEAFRERFRAEWMKDPLKVWKQIILPLVPRETTLQVSQAMNDTLSSLTVTQLRQIAGLEPEEKVIDISEGAENERD